jgi:hypothetical protein
MKNRGFVLAAVLAGGVALSAASLVRAAPEDQRIEGGRPIKIEPVPDSQPIHIRPEANGRPIHVEREPNAISSNNSERGAPERSR